VVATVNAFFDRGLFSGLASRHDIPKLQGKIQGGMASKERTHGQKNTDRGD
jgi:hypothetical protein